MSKSSETLVIIGSGPAGWSAATYAARAQLRPLVFEGAITEENRMSGTLPLGQLALTSEVENYAGFPHGNLSEFLSSALPENRRSMMAPHAGEGVTGPELMELMRQQAINFGTRIVTDDILKVDFSKRPFTLYTRSKDTVEAQCVIVATGASANWLGLPSEEAYKNRGVSACAVCDGALPRFRNKPMVVIGGGDSAVEEATYLTKFASMVHLIHRRDSLRASKIMAQRAQNEPKITIHFHSALEEVLGNDALGVTGVKLQSTIDPSRVSILDAAGVFLAIGHTPNTAFLDGQLDLTAKKYIVWKKHFRTDTSVDGVFAAGDVADDYYRQAISAAGTGCMSALDAERWLSHAGIHA
ncbi:MAG: thioredoxin-disulfide reductase [Planctomycetia bacterium]|nr:thioredoxin-disulfide reductase [Planctomycetia bacterium]RLS29473.1 MAG: thioredoxin-disulfide reductase [Planctomycetota bacterium]